jgi:hypothetical protein
LKQRRRPDHRRPLTAPLEPFGRIHLAVCIPAESMPIESIRCLTRLLRTCLTNPPRLRPNVPTQEFTLSEHYLASSMLPYARSWLCRSAIEAGATHVLLLDSDMTYPADTAHRLVLGVERCGGFVAANCVTRRAPIRWTAVDLAGEQHDSRAHRSTTWSSVQYVGPAVGCISAAAYEKLEVPQWNFAHTPKGWVGEDIWFCERLRAAGISIVVDNQLSIEVGHVGSHEFTPAEVPERGRQSRSE